jgi:hypothetical protein
MSVRRQASDLVGDVNAFRASGSFFADGRVALHQVNDVRAIQPAQECFETQDLLNAAS